VAVIWWSGRGGNEVRMREGIYPTLPVNKFVELTVDLPCGKARRLLEDKQLWWTADDEKPFKWPPCDWPVPIAVPSVYLKGDFVRRHLSIKEACQLLDMPGVSSSRMITNIWTWNNGCPVPLRIPVAFLLRSSKWLGKEAVIHEDKSTNVWLPDNDLSTLLLQTKAQHEVGETGLFRLSYFRWVWEPTSEGEVTVATKADGAGIDKSLWAVGDEAPRMEEARETMRRAFHRAWYNRLWKEAMEYYRCREALPQRGVIDAVELCKDESDPRLS
jgi:hypothetical protein